jgi:ribosomal protein S18 acetylase RimI-like enzyme
VHPVSAPTAASNEHFQMTTHPTIRRLGPTDAALWREIRLGALRTAPEAFGQTFEHASSQPFEHFERAVSGSHPIFAADITGVLVGSAGFYVMDGPKVSHRGVLWGMFVDPEHRKAGIGKALIGAVIGYARGRVDQVHLTVVAENVDAYRLYHRMGFQANGVEPSALRYNGRDYDETLMVRAISSAASD